MSGQPHPSSQFTCSARSKAVGEQIFGTAPQEQFWILLGYPQAPGGKAYEEASIPEAARQYLNRTLTEIPHSRLLLIRQSAAESIILKVVRTNDRHPALFAYSLTGYLDLLEIDFPLLANVEADNLASGASRPIWVVCTNGKRDPCCAQWGQPLFHALETVAAGEVFQSSHLGGHRFAANAVCFPDGVYYGRLQASDAGKLLEAMRTRKVLLENYRGRVYYPPAAQAGEFFLRSHTGNLDLDAYRLEGANPLEEHTWQVRFTQANAESSYTLEIEATWSQFENFESCTKPEKQSRRLQYHLRRIHGSG